MTIPAPVPAPVAVPVAIPIAGSQALARLGAEVRTRLAANAEVYRVPAEGIELFALGGFLADEECAQLCAMIDAIARPSGLHELDYASGYRTSYSGDLDPRGSLVA